MFRRREKVLGGVTLNVNSASRWVERLRVSLIVFCVILHLKFLLTTNIHYLHPFLKSHFYKRQILRDSTYMRHLEHVSSWRE